MEYMSISRHEAYQLILDMDWNKHVLKANHNSCVWLFIVLYIYIYIQYIYLLTATMGLEGAHASNRDLC